MDKRRLLCILITCSALFPICPVSAQSIPAKLLEESERTYNDKIGAYPDAVEPYLYPLLEPCSLSPTAILELKDGKYRVAEQPISEEGRKELREIQGLPKNKRHQQLYELNRLYARDSNFVKALTLRGKVFVDMREYSKSESPLLKAIEANPIDYEAYTYLGYSYLKRDELAAAKAAYIKSVLYNPGNTLGWKGLKSVGVKLGFDAKSRVVRKGAWMLRVSEKEIDLYIDSGIQEKETVGPWMSFITAKAAWLYEGVFAAKNPGAASYFYTIEEDLYAYNFMLDYWQLLKTKKKVSDPDLDFLLELRERDLLPAYLLFEEVGPICPEIIVVQPPKTIRQMETYIDEYVLIPVKGPVETEQEESEK